MSDRQLRTRHRLLRRLLAGVPLAILAASWTTPPADPSHGPQGTEAETFLPIYHEMDGLPVAEIRGRLIEDDRCLWIEQPEGRVLPLWPSDSRIERDGTATVVVNSRGARAQVGTEVDGGGGEYAGPAHLDAVVEAIGEPIPGACRGDDRYWIVYDVRTADD